MGKMRLNWRKTGDFPRFDNRIAYLPDESYYLIESDGEGREWYLRRYPSGLGSGRHIGIFPTLLDAERAAEVDVMLPKRITGRIT
jgi:hypothetical protein